LLPLARLKLPLRPACSMQAGLAWFLARLLLAERNHGSGRTDPEDRPETGDYAFCTDRI